MLTKDKDVKCWGSGLYGQLGHESTDDIGDDAGEMAALRPVYLGAGKTAIAVSVGFSHSCAILNDRTLKCWGMGADGRLGYDSTDNKGDALGEMGVLGSKVRRAARLEGAAGQPAAPSAAAPAHSVPCVRAM